MDRIPTNWQELAFATETHSINIRRPGLCDPFGRYTNEYGFVVELYPLNNQIKADYRGFGRTLDEAIRSLEEVKPDR